MSSGKKRIKGKQFGKQRRLAKPAAGKKAVKAIVIVDLSFFTFCSLVLFQAILAILLI